MIRVDVPSHRLVSTVERKKAIHVHDLHLGRDHKFAVDLSGFLRINPDCVFALKDIVALANSWKVDLRLRLTNWVFTRVKSEGEIVTQRPKLLQQRFSSNRIEYHVSGVLCHNLD